MCKKLCYFTQKLLPVKRKKNVKSFIRNFKINYGLFDTSSENVNNYANKSMKKFDIIYLFL